MLIVERRCAAGIPLPHVPQTITEYRDGHAFRRGRLVAIAIIGHVIEHGRRLRILRYSIDQVVELSRRYRPAPAFTPRVPASRPAFVT